MIKIKKIENMFGIKKLKNPTFIDGNTIIYAPNGVMKTSFADGINAIINGNRPSDKFANPEILSTFEIEDNGIVITDESSGISLNAFVFKPSNYNADVFSNPNIGSLVMSNTLKIKYKKALDEYQSERNRINEIISRNIFGKKKLDQSDIDTVIEVLEKNTFEDAIISIPDLSDYNDLYYQSINYYDIFNDKTSTILDSTEFSEKCKSYNKYINSELDKAVFNSGFDFNGLLDVQKKLNSSHYFDAGNKIILNGKEEMSKAELQTYIQGTIDKVYGTENARIIFEDAKKALNKNEKTKKLIKIINEDKRCFKELSNTLEFKRKIIFTKMSAYSDDINISISKMKDYLDNMKKLIEEAKKSKEIWQSVLDKYNNRFFNNKFDVIIENTKDAVLGISQPVFKKVIRGTDQVITSEIFNRFSSGEQRAIMILNLLFEIELRKSQNYALVLDDISDSFDYKNKYAILEYLQDLASFDNVQLIILTHNFDFFRSVRLLLKSKLKSILMAYKNGEDVELVNAKRRDLEDYSYFSLWKNNNNEKSVLAIIPFLRNIIQLQYNSDNEKFKILTGMLHYNEELEKINISCIYNILDSFNVRHDFDDFNYLNKLREISLLIISNNSIKETNLLEKVILGMFIRIFSDKIMYLKYIECYGDKQALEEVSNQSRFLYEKIKNELPDETLQIIQTSMTIAPSFIHVNSFMFEPLIDVGAEKLKETAQKIDYLLKQTT